MPTLTDPNARLPISAWRHSIALAAGVGIYVFLSIASFVWIDEDAYIAFRIAENLAAGHGYVFNIGGETIELGSSVLWQFLLVPLTWLPVPTVIAAKVVGVALGCVSLGLLYRLGLRFLETPALAALPVLATAVSVPFVLWNQGGLETALYGTLILAYALALTSEAHFERWWWPAAFLVLARPEGIVLCAAAWPALARRQHRGAVVRGTLAVACVLAVATALRVAYFHDFLPHPFYARFKTDPGLGILGLLNIAETHRLWLFGLPFALACGTPSFWTRRTGHLVVLAGLLIAWAAYAAEFKPYFRHLVPALPLVSLLLVAGATQVTSFLGRAGPPLAIAYGWGWVLMGAFLAVIPLKYAEREANPLHAWARNFARQPIATLQGVAAKTKHPEAVTLLDETSPSGRTLGTNYQARVGQFIAANYPAGITVVYDQMGQTPYYAGADKWFVDSWGLAHRAIGLHRFGARTRESALLSAYRDLADAALLQLYPAEERTVPIHKALEEIFDRQPELILTNEYILATLENTLPHRIEEHPRLAREYQRRYVLDGLVNVYERRGLFGTRAEAPDGLAVETVDPSASDRTSPPNIMEIQR